MSGYRTIRIVREGRVATITLDRREALNALNLEVMEELTAATRELDGDHGVGCIVIAGGERAFAAGADIKEMMSRDSIEMYANDWFGGWEALRAVRTPLLAAIAGFALGGGCELAMMCDVLIAADDAQFGQPEIKLGVMPGMGGSQLLTRAIGRARAMEMCLTGRTMGAEEAERAGLVSRVVPVDRLAEEAGATAATIASMSLPAAMMVKEAVNRASEVSLAEGLRFERRLFHSMFASYDQKEGMAAFVEKRPPSFRNE